MRRNRRRLLYVAVFLSIAVNVLAARMFYTKYWHPTYMLQERVRTMSKQLGVKVQPYEYRVIFADDSFGIARDPKGSYLFHSQQSGEPVSRLVENNGGESDLKGDCRCMVSSRKFFASWRIGADKCDRVVFQYNDIGRKDDPDGNWDVRSSVSGRRASFAEKGQLKTQSQIRSLDAGSEDAGGDKRDPSSTACEHTDSTDSSPARCSASATATGTGGSHSITQ